MGNKKIVESIPYEKEEIKLKELISKYDVISFDIFDTLLLREVLNPTDLFDLFIYKLDFHLTDVLKENGNSDCDLTFKTLRIQSEIDARKTNFDKEDITLDDIYEVISKKIGNDKALQMKKAEIELENEFIVINPFMKKIYNYALSLSKKIIIITDMYLPKKFLEEKLFQLGYTGYAGLYVSGEINMTKATLSIFPYVQNKYKINKEKWLHIGDNEISDILNPREFGIFSYYYKKVSDREKIEKVDSIEESIITAMRINKLYTEPELSYWEKFGVDKLSPLYFGFTNWLVQLTKNKDNLYFLARDGYIPYKIYEMFRKYEPNLPTSKYIYASRRAYQYSHIIKMEKNEAIALLTEFNWGAGQRLFLRDIFKNLGLDSSKYIDIFPIFGIISADDEIRVDTNLHQIRKFLSYIFPDILRQIKEEYKLLVSYMEKEGMNQFDQINIVDIGWRGSTQFAIKEILDKDIEGYYFGTISTMNPKIYSNSLGFYFDLDIPIYNKEIVFNNIMMYELIFSAPHGSLIKFKKEKDEIIPILKEVEKNSNNYIIVQKFQNAALSMMDFYLSKYKYLKNTSAEVSVRAYRDFVLEYRTKDLIQFKDLSNNLGIGINSDVRSYVNVINYEEWYKNKSMIYEVASKSLWVNSVLIKKDNSYISMHEGEVYDFLQSEIKRKNKNLLLKVIMNPKKTIKKILQLKKNNRSISNYLKEEVKARIIYKF